MRNRYSLAFLNLHIQVANIIVVRHHALEFFFEFHFFLRLISTMTMSKINHEETMTDFITYTRHTPQKPNFINYMRHTPEEPHKTNFINYMRHTPEELHMTNFINYMRHTLEKPYTCILSNHIHNYNKQDLHKSCTNSNQNPLSFYEDEDSLV
jgi:hypothetical protein